VAEIQLEADHTGDGADRRVTWLDGVAIGLATLTVVGLVVLWPDKVPDFDPTTIGLATEMVEAEVTAASTMPCSYAEVYTCHRVDFLVLTGEDAGLETWQEFEESHLSPQFEPGERVVLNVLTNAELGFTFQFGDRDRRPVLWALGAVFALAVVALGRMRGVAALAGLAVSVLLLTNFIAPSMLAGNDPVIVATVGGAAIALIALYMSSGWNALTHVALIGTFAALAITLGLSWLVSAAAGFSGIASDEAVFVSFVPGIDVSGLILAGAVLGAIGALDDITVTQASTVLELHKIGEETTAAELRSAGLRVGRDHIGATINTLLLAYAGASIPLLLLYSLSELRLDFVANSEVVAVEIVRTLVGSIGLVAAVPITTWLAAEVVARFASRSAAK
jgi:uncharacterized membrane protein